MRVPVGWLREYCDPPLTTRELADRLNLTGTEVGRIERAGVPDAAEFVVGKVLAAERHPNADRLTVCEVDDGSGPARTIVCGAPNVAAGQTVAVARPGAVMPGGQVLGEAELRGVTSSGMILAEDEVGIGEDHAGIMVLSDELPAGAPLAEHLQIADDVLDLEIAPNRPDCLAVYGVAREVHAATAAPLREDPTAADVEPAGGDHAGVAVEIADPDVCLRFTARVFEDVTIGPSPLWLKARLTAAGQRPINNVVDITNYVMLLAGQPLHAFDLDRVRGGRIVVRRARDGETMTTLDGVERSFGPDTALVCDAEGASGIAGIMGGQVSEVSDSTTRVLMEAATWVGTNILRTSARLGLRTEASTRFEKQLHPELAVAGQRLAARLMVELCGARLVGDTIDAYPAPVRPRTVALRPERVASLLGTEVPADDIRAILERLGFGVDGDGPLQVSVPPWRFSDVEREADLIEEVGRVHGLDRLPVTLPARRRAVGRLTPSQRLRRRLEDALRDRGLTEAVSYSFTAPATLRRLRLPEEPIRVANPLNEEHSAMRPLILPGLLDAARYNAARGRPGARLFESAHVYPPPLWSAAGGNGASPRGATPVGERHHLAVLLAGRAEDGWRTPAPPADFYAAKGLLEALLDASSVGARFDPAEWPFLHPGRAASVVARSGRELGWIGELHPAILGDWDLDAGAAFEVDADALAELAPGPAAYRDVTSFPPVLQDIAVVLPEDVPAAEVEAAVRLGGGELLAEARIFDVYRGEQVGEGERSLALRLRFQAPDRTLTDEDVAELRAAIEARLGELGGRLRA